MRPVSLLCLWVAHWRCLDAGDAPGGTAVVVMRRPGLGRGRCRALKKDGRRFHQRNDLSGSARRCAGAFSSDNTAATRRELLGDARQLRALIRPAAIGLSTSFIQVFFSRRCQRQARPAQRPGPSAAVDLVRGTVFRYCRRRRRCDSGRRRRGRHLIFQTQVGRSVVVSGRAKLRGLLLRHRRTVSTGASRRRRFITY